MAIPPQDFCETASNNDKNRSGYFLLKIHLHEKEGTLSWIAVTISQASTVSNILKYFVFKKKGDDKAGAAYKKT
jgi:hypothetical protein